MSVWSLFAWVLVVGLGALVGSVLARVTGHAGLAVAQDALVYVLVVAWLVLTVAVVTRSWLLVMAGGALVAYHLVLLVPRLWTNRVPRWVRRAPRLTLVVANVFIDNETPASLARALLAADADVIVIAEWNPRFVSAFDAAGAATAYPHRVFDPSDRSDYAVGIVSRLPLQSGSTMVRIGPLRLAKAVTAVGGRRVTILGLNPMAVVDAGGYDIWDEQMDALIAHLPSVTGPYVVAGDMNTTTYRPKTRELLACGLTDSHECLGKGLSTSFKLAAHGVLAAPGAVVRLDHVLASTDIRPVSATDLPSEGSDHIPFKVELAVNSTTDRQGRSSWPTARGPATRSTTLPR